MISITCKRPVITYAQGHAHARIEAHGGLKIVPFRDPLEAHRGPISKPNEDQKGAPIGTDAADVAAAP
jgi:hypothetical protein